MIEINTVRLHTCGVPAETCKDGSVRLVKYKEVQKPKDYLTMQKGYSWEGTSYSLSVHLPPPREVATVVTVSHTSTNSWRVTASSSESSDVFVFSTLMEVNAKLENLLK